ncbi:MAG: hypothetical protein LQ343_003459 [Gyalolechia ehrenbergii]|nr:MAG: hypothetical protein LQ343_003459 [Gyalolechia ehrenbergii]
MPISLWEDVSTIRSSDPLAVWPPLTNAFSFCRKTTLTKHFKRYHPIKAEDSGMPLIDEADEDPCGDSDEDDSGSDSELSPPETQMNRQSSYYGDHWPLPCETAQHPNPSSLQGPLALRPKSTLDRVKLERPRSVSPQLIRSIPPTDCSTSFPISRGRTMSIQTQMEQDFNQIPLPTPFPSEQNVKTSSSPCPFRTENSMDSLASPSTMQSSPTSYSDISSVPDNAHATLFFAGPTSQPYSPQDEPPSMGYQSVVPIEDPIQDAGQQQYDMDAKPMIQTQFMCEGNQMDLQQQPIQNLTYYDGVAYQAVTEQYYSSPPAWYTNIKPEETWPGLMPSERVQMYAGWNQ